MIKNKKRQPHSIQADSSECKNENISQPIMLLPSTIKFYQFKEDQHSKEGISRSEVKEWNKLSDKVAEAESTDQFRIQIKCRITK